MVSKTHHNSFVRYALAGTLGALGIIAASGQVANADQVVVKAGDTVWKIAQEHGTNVHAIENANPGSIKKLNDSVDLIYAGQQLTLPGGNHVQLQSDGTYVVAPGDTLAQIAREFNVTVSQLESWNGLTSEQLYIGQRLNVTGPQVAVNTGAQQQTPVNEQTTVSDPAPVASVSDTSEDQSTTPAQEETVSASPVEDSTAVTSTANAAATNAVVTPATASNAPTSVAPQASTSSAVSQDTSSGASDQSAPATSAQTTTDYGLASAYDQPAASGADQNVAANQGVKQPTANTSVETTSAATSTVTSQATQPVSAGATTTATSDVQTEPTSTVYSNAAFDQGQQVTTTTSASTTPVSQAASQPVASSASVSVSAQTSQTAASSTVASQTPVSQAPAAQSQQPQSATTSQPAQSTTPAQSSAAATTTPSASQSMGASDLQNGSVVSLAVKIANSNSVPYVWGGASLSGMDCSGLVDYVYAHAEGKQLPHNTVALESYVNQHPVSQAQAGDILFWGNHGATYHSAIYIGNNQFVAAAKPGTNVATYTISKYFEPSFAGTVK